MLLPGNCFLGALLLKARYGGRMKRLKRSGHWVVNTPHDGTWHFTVKYDVLPRPLHWVVFLGRFERLNDKA